MLYCFLARRCGFLLGILGHLYKSEIFCRGNISQYEVTLWTIEPFPIPQVFHLKNSFQCQKKNSALGSILAGIPYPMMLTLELGNPEFKTTGQRTKVLILTSQAYGIGESLSHQATLVSFFWDQIPDVPIGCPWLRFVQIPPLCCLASFILSGTAAAASQPTAPFWDASGNSWNTPKGWFYTTESGTKYFPLHGKCIKEIPLRIGSSKIDRILLWELLALFIFSLLNQFVVVSIFCINVSCFSEAQIEVAD